MSADITNTSPTSTKGFYKNSNYNFAKILIVDDRPANLLATRKVLKSLNVNVIEANSGNKALSMMLRHDFAVVLLDVQMPEMDGFEVAKLMQDEESMKNTPVIFITAISKEEHFADKAAEIGAVDYIYKPINPRILKSKVQVYIDLYKQNQNLKKLNETLQKNNEELERFAYICSHDLQEPARMMTHFSEFLYNDYQDKLDKDGRQYIEIINKNAKHMQKMINDILTFSKVDYDKAIFEKVDCQKIAEEIAAELKFDIEQKSVKLKIDNLPTIITSKTLISILLQNLIGNAIKYQDGSRPPEISVLYDETPDEWVFKVSDNGIGIEKEYQEKVFAMFQRIHRKEDYPGTGIGLCTCKKFIENYGGKLWFDSQLGSGTTFYFSVPKNIGEKL